MRSTKKPLFKIAFPIAMVIFSALAGLQMKGWNLLNAINPFLVIFILSMTIGYLAMYLLKRGLKLSHAQLRKWIIPGLLLFYAGTYLTANLSISVVVFFTYLIKGHDMSSFLPNLFRYELSYGNSNLHFWLMLFTIGFFYILWVKSSKKEQSLREEKLKFQYQNLKSQVNPHFLFNSLNALSELVYEDARRADEYIQELSKIYRYVIENEEKRQVGLDQELGFVQRYFKLQNIRTDGKVLLVISIENAEQYKIIPVSLQIMLENAIKHNRATIEKPLHISISMEDNKVLVRNNLQRKISLENSTQRGLSSLKEQLKLIQNKELEIIETEKDFVVKVPIEKI